MAGDDIYDVIINDMYPLANLSIEGLFHNVKNNQYIQFDEI